MDEDVYQTVNCYIPENYNKLGALDPAVLLQHIEARLVTADQLEFERMHFELAKQTSAENPWKYENRLLSHYRLAQINDEGSNMDIYKKGVHNKELRKLLYCTPDSIKLRFHVRMGIHKSLMGLLMTGSNRTY